MTEPVTIYFELEDMLVEAPLQSSFMDVVQESGADVTFGCRNGTCGTCRVEVTEGLDTCAPPNAEEADFLKNVGASACQRLGCQLTINGSIAVKYIGT